MIRVAAVGDVHYGNRTRNDMRTQFSSLAGRADLLLLAGDLTQSGGVEEAQALVGDLQGSGIPTVAVLGNHDYHQNKSGEISAILTEAGVTVLEGTGSKFVFRNQSVGIVGLKGFGGGFFGACVTEFGEPEMKAFARHCKHQADLLNTALGKMDAEIILVLLHYSPIEATLLGERREIYPFMGSYLLAEAIDRHSVNGVFHGHAHFGAEKGVTPGGVSVRNVALPVIRHAYNIYLFESRRREA